MFTRNNRITFALSTVGFLLAALPVSAKALQKSPKTALQVATIENTGSTNTRGYQISVTAAGYAEYGMTERGGAVTDGKAQVKKLARPLIQAFFRHLAAAMPLTSLTVRHGMKSASFGTSTYVTYKGQRSPDLTFGGDAKAAALKADIDAITKALHVGNAPRRPASSLMQPVTPPSHP